MTKTTQARKRPRRRASGSEATAVARRHDVITSANDHFAAALRDLVPEDFKDTDRYLNIVQWNIEWFGARKSEDKDKLRRGLVLDVLKALNADLFVFQEIAGPTSDGRYPGALDDIAEQLTADGDGDYVVFYTAAGGEQRVAMMYDREWIRAKRDVEELFHRGDHQAAGQKDPFAGRTPLYGYFTGRVPSTDGGEESDLPPYFDFQALGVHLKAMADGHPQRRASAEILAAWLTGDAMLIDSDVIILGDFNAPPDEAKSWEPFHRLEDAGRLAFRGINDLSNISYMWMQNLTTKFGSRIDLAAMSLSSMAQVVGQPAQVVRWKPIDDALADAGTMTDKRVREVMTLIKENLSDHFPVATRFYVSSRREDARRRR